MTFVTILVWNDADAASAAAADGVAADVTGPNRIRRTMIMLLILLTEVGQPGTEFLDLHGRKGSFVEVSGRKALVRVGL